MKRQMLCAFGIFCMLLTTGMTSTAVATPGMGLKSENPLMSPNGNDPSSPLAVTGLGQIARLYASDNTVGDYFGYAVAMDGDTVVVGAERKNNSQGAAYVFIKPAGGWTSLYQVAKLTASDPSSGQYGDYFGRSVAIDGDTIVVGGGKYPSSLEGAYVFVKPAGGWKSTTETAKLISGGTNNGFASSVSISGDTIVAGASNSFPGGQALVFVKPAQGWTNNMLPTATLSPAAVTTSHIFGVSVSISGDTILVSDYMVKNLTYISGAAYIFTKPSGGWGSMHESAKLTASDMADSDLFGQHVSLSGNTAVVTAWGQASFTGAVYVFSMPANGWVDMTQTAKLTASDGAASNYFGYVVAVNNQTVVVGAHEAAYVFLRPAGGWANKTQDAKLKAPVPTSSACFGCAVGASNNLVVVGEESHYYDSGAAYLFGQVTRIYLPALRK